MKVVDWRGMAVRALTWADEPEPAVDYAVEDEIVLQVEASLRSAYADGLGRAIDLLTAAAVERAIADSPTPAQVAPRLRRLLGDEADKLTGRFGPGRPKAAKGGAG